MPLTYAYLCVTVALAAALIFDCRAQRLFVEAGKAQDPNERATDTVLMLSPFLVFFYPEGFWLNFAGFMASWLHGFMALWAMGCLAVFALNTLGRLDNKLEMQKMMVVGVPLLVGLGYLIFYHDGPLLSAATENISQSSGQGIAQENSPIPPWVWWVYGLLIASSVFVARFKDGTLIAATGLLLGLVIMPFYTGYFWWSLGAGALIFLLSVNALLHAVDSTGKGGIGFVLVWMAQMAFMGSVVVYAIFF